MGKCISPITIKVPGRSERITVSCQKCNFCLQARRNSWSFRLHQEAHHSQTAHFLTLTYDTEHLPLDGDNADNFCMTLRKQEMIRWHKTVKEDQQRTLKKIRTKQKLNKDQFKQLQKKWKIKYYSVGEYGSVKGRPHYHSIMFNIHPKTLQKLYDGKTWTKGGIQFGTVGYRSIAYVTKYVIDKDVTPINELMEKPFSIMSKGLGATYLNKKRKWNKAQGMEKEDMRYYVSYQGNAMAMPRYYKDRIFTKMEKQWFGQQAIDQATEIYLEEIKRLAQYHEDPFHAYEENMMREYNKVKSKSKQLNSL